MFEPDDRNLLGDKGTPAFGSRGWLELAKIIGALAWIAGVIFVFVFPPFGFLILLVALLISIFTATKTRQARHKEIVQAASSVPQAPRTQRPRSAGERLDELTRLKEAGTLSDDEFEVKRKEIIDGI